MSWSLNDLKERAQGETVFLQFYSDRRQRTVDPDLGSLQLFNGFSSLHRTCKGLGRMVWRRELWWTELERHEIEPVWGDTMFVSAFTTPHLEYANQLARINQDSTVYVGGPAIIYSYDWDLYHEPNVVLVREPIERKAWALEPPEIACTELQYSFPIEDGCYYGKCEFCTYPVHGDHRYGLVDLRLTRAGSEDRVWLHTLALSPKAMRYKLHRLPSQNRYNVQMRADGLMLDHLHLLGGLDYPERFRFYLGIECPSNPVLRRWRKGTDADTMAAVVNRILEFGCEVYLFFIMGVPWYQDRDVWNVRRFLAKIEGEDIPCSLYQYVLHDHLRKTHQGPVRVVSDGGLIERYFKIYIPDLTEEEKSVNDKLRDVYYSSPVLKVTDDTYTHRRPNWRMTDD